MSSPARFKQTPVIDADDERIGTVIGTELSENTREPRNLLISLEPSIKNLTPLDQDSLWLSFEQVQAIRRSELQLSRSLQDLIEDSIEKPSIND